MLIRFAICVVVVSFCPTLAEVSDWEAVISDLTDKTMTLTKEEEHIEAQIRILEEQSKVQEDNIKLLQERLAGLNVEPGGFPAQPTELKTNPAPEKPLPWTAPEAIKRKEMLTSQAAARMVILEAANDEAVIAFLAPREGKTQIITPAQWIAGNRKFSVSDLAGNAIPITQNFSSPINSDLLGLQPEKSDLPHFDLAVESELPKVGERILVVAIDEESKKATGIEGTLRGMGPDTFEIDAELSPELTGAPVLAVESGKVIGIVAPQVAGVANDWAAGTRHEASRNFALRLDRIDKWQDGDLGRFTKEAAYIEKINHRTQLSWAAYMLIDCEIGHRHQAPSRSNFPSYESYKRALEEWKSGRIRLKELAMDYADKNPSDPQIKKALNWAAELREIGNLEPGGALDIKRVNIYRLILADLRKKEPDLSAHLSDYHKKQYQLAMANREIGIETTAEETIRIGK